MDFRRKAFGLFNDIEQSSIENNSSISFNSFIKQIFSHRQTRIGNLNNCLLECLDWKFDPFNIDSFATMWASTLSLSSIMTPTDINSLKTVNYVIDILKTRHPASIKICTLFDKPERREAKVTADYSGSVVPDEFIVGYGLDYDEKYRNLPYIGVLKPEIYG